MCLQVDDDNEDGGEFVEAVQVGLIGVWSSSGSEPMSRLWSFGGFAFQAV
jgi:hypothetical protein